MEQIIQQVELLSGRLPSAGQLPIFATLVFACRYIQEGIQNMEQLTIAKYYGHIRPVAEELKTTFGQVDEWIQNTRTDSYNEGYEEAAKTHPKIAKMDAELMRLRAAKPASPDQVKNTHRSVKTAIKIARFGLWAGGFALAAGAVTQIPPIVALGWCSKQQGDGAKAECYTTGVCAIVVGLLAGVGAGYSWAASYMQYDEQKLHQDPDISPAL